LDGSGYPDGLKGDEIPISTQIIAVADIFDALTSTWLYKEKWTNEAAVSELKSLAGVKLDSDCVMAICNNPGSNLRISQAPRSRSKWIPGQARHDDMRVRSGHPVILIPDQARHDGFRIHLTNRSGSSFKIKMDTGSSPA